jgi:hypothetical protein
MFRLNSPGAASRAAASQDAHDRQAYIPPHIENAMADHMRQTLPPHLKRFQGGGTYVPQQAAQAISDHMESTLPGHMKPYADAYMQQRVLQPASRASLAAPASEAAAEPGTDTVAPQQAAGQVFAPGGTPAGVPPAGPSTAMAPDASAPAPGASVPPTGAPGAGLSPAGPASDTPAPEPDSRDQSYAFITNPALPAKPSTLSRIPLSGSLVGRVGLVAGALLVLVIIFAIFKSLLVSGPNVTPVITVAQDQQELLHILQKTNGLGLSANNQNFASTLQVSVTTSQQKTISYLTAAHKKINVKQLNLKVSPSTDNRLKAAQAAATYDQTFTEVMQAKLTEYGKDIQTAYKLDAGKKGRALLKETYAQQQLLLLQLTSPAT